MRLVAVILILLTSVACKSVNTRNEVGTPMRMTKQEFAAYTEATFRHHNTVMNDLILLSSLGSEEELADPQLVRAEHDMTEACKPLNEMVTATIEGVPLTMWSKLQLPNQVPACEAATQRVEAVMPETF